MLDLVEINGKNVEIWSVQAIRHVEVNITSGLPSKHSTKSGLDEWIFKLNNRRNYFIINKNNKNFDI